RPGGRFGNRVRGSRLTHAEGRARGVASVRRGASLTTELSGQSLWWWAGPPCRDVPLMGGGVSRAYSIRVGGGALSFSEAIKTCFQKFAEFRGRASRPEFWGFPVPYPLGFPAGRTRLCGEGP